jgi:hypothetical protein
VRQVYLNEEPATISKEFDNIIYDNLFPIQPIILPEIRVRDAV